MNTQNLNFGPSHPDVTWLHMFDQLDRNGPSLNIQIRKAIVLAIETGMLKSGDRMPSSRRLASMLGVARNTVTNAYQMLTDEEVLISRQRQGIYIAEREQASPTPTYFAPVGDHWKERFAARPSELRHFHKPRNWIDYPYPFLYGQFDPSIFPANNWREATRVTNSVQEISGWASDLIDDDDPDLVEQLRVQVLPNRGIFARAEEILITIGSQQALSILVQLLVGRDSVVGIEDPGYPDFRNMVSLAAGGYRSLTVDEMGLVPDEQLSPCDLAFVTPDQQCPTTVTMSKDRRRALLQMGDEHDIVFIEDDYEADLKLDKEDKIAPLKSMDESGRVIYVGSFSKSLAPGLRIGFIVAPSAVIDELRVLRRLLMRHPPTNNQRIMATFIGLGHYQQHLQKTSQILKGRAELIETLLPRYLPTCRWQRAPGAKSFWIQLPEGLDCHTLEGAARQYGVLVEAADIFFADPEAGLRYFRLGFTSIKETYIESGLSKLGDVITTMQAAAQVQSALDQFKISKEPELT